MRLSILTLALLLSLGSFAQSTVKGVVYEDLNRNGKKESREKGIPAVAVTNGIEVVLTDSKGWNTACNGWQETCGDCGDVDRR